MLLQLAPISLDRIAHESRRYTIDSSSHFEIGDTCSYLRNTEDPEGLGFVRLTSLRTVSTTAGVKMSFFKGTLFAEVGHNETLCKPIFEEAGESQWLFCSDLVHRCVAHHNCTVGCKIKMVCSRHQYCDESCPLAEFVWEHSIVSTVILHDFKNICG